MEQLITEYIHSPCYQTGPDRIKMVGATLSCAKAKKQFLSTAETASLERTDQGHIHYAFMRGCQLLRKYNESAGTLVKGLAVTD